MAKRFIDTGIFADDWFCELTSDAKVAWIYLMTNCDHAGIFKVNERLFQFQTGIKGFDTVMKEFENRLVTVRDGYFFIPGFIVFQYGKDLNTNVPLHRSVVKRLEEFNLIIDNKIKGLNNTYISAKNKNKSKDKNKENIGGGTGEPKVPTAAEIFDPATAVKKLKEYSGPEWQSWRESMCMTHRVSMESLLKSLKEFFEETNLSGWLAGQPHDEIRKYFQNKLKKGKSWVVPNSVNQQNTKLSFSINKKK